MHTRLVRSRIKSRDIYVIWPFLFSSGRSHQRSVDRTRPVVITVSPFFLLYLFYFQSTRRLWNNIRSYYWKRDIVACVYCIWSLLFATIETCTSVPIDRQSKARTSDGMCYSLNSSYRSVFNICSRRRFNWTPVLIGSDLLYLISVLLKNTLIADVIINVVSRVENHAVTDKRIYFFPFCL